MGVVKRMDPLINTLANLGLGGAIAALVLYWKRQDDIRYQKFLEATVTRYEGLMIRLLEVLTGNTTAITLLKAEQDESIKLGRIEKLITDFQLAQQQAKSKSAA